MAPTLAKNLIHLVYGTKSRRPWLAEEIRPDLFAYQAGIFGHCDSPAVVIGGVADHVHALFTLSKNTALKDVIERVKRSSSRWLKRYESCGDFRWQNGYAAFSVSESQAPAVRRYIERQPEHHRRMTYEQELRLLFERHHVADKFDEADMLG